MITLAIEEVYVDFKKLSRQRPSTYQSTVFYSFLCKASRVIGWGALAVGLFLIIASITNYIVFTGLRSDRFLFPERVQGINADYIILAFQAILGSTFLLIGAGIFAIQTLCNMIIRRNNYINQLEDLYQKMDLEGEEA